MREALKLWSRSFVVMCLVLMLGSPLTHAQTAGSTATISGKILDPDGQIVPNATVTAKNDLTGLTRSVKTGPDGRFSVGGLPVGNYTIEVAAEGFTTARSAGLQLAANGLENTSIR